MYFGNRHILNKSGFIRRNKMQNEKKNKVTENIIKYLE